VGKDPFNNRHLVYWLANVAVAFGFPLEFSFLAWSGIHPLACLKRAFASCWSGLPNSAISLFNEIKSATQWFTITELKRAGRTGHSVLGYRTWGQ